ncbi:MAG: HdeD family acid-resistance protein [Actinomycetia bacterium]|jgi:uncharacterized membrane protein HdeD (DUF308 family)|nr:HdeD family acid-resistance protein [Actinomycetes bacterium]
MTSPAASSRSDVQDVLASIGRNWGWLLFGAVVSILVGIALLAWPKATVLVIAVLLGSYLLVSGVFQFVMGFATRDVSGGTRALMVLSGGLSFVLGLMMFKGPYQAASILALLIGFGWLFRGIAELVGGISDKGASGRGWQIFLGLLGVLAGITVIVWPISSLAVLAWVSGIWLIVIGIVQVFAAFAVRKLARA